MIAISVGKVEIFSAFSYRIYALRGFAQLKIAEPMGDRNSLVRWVAYEGSFEVMHMGPCSKSRYSSTLQMQESDPIVVNIRHKSFTMLALF